MSKCNRRIAIDWFNTVWVLFSLAMFFAAGWLIGCVVQSMWNDEDF